MIAQLVEATVNDTRAHPQGSGQRDQDFHEPHWGHTTAVLQGNLSIDQNDQLPEAFRVGLFKEARDYQVVARPNFIHDPKAGLGVSRVAVKLKYHEAIPNVYAESGQASELDLLFAEGEADVNGAFHAFPLRDARQLLMFTKLAEPSLKMVGVLLDPRNWGLLFRLIKKAISLKKFFPNTPTHKQGWAGKHYYALGPFRLGQGAMKMCLRPLQTHTIAPLELDRAALGQKEAMREWMAQGEDAQFELCVQLATEQCIPEPGENDPSKAVMTAEYCDLQWDEIASPFVRVGVLTFSSDQQELSRKYPWSPLQFNAWNTLPSMAPLGQLFRARRFVHKGHCEFRLQHIYETKPGQLVDRAPFDQQSSQPDA